MGRRQGKRAQRRSELSPKQNQKAMKTRTTSRKYTRPRLPTRSSEHFLPQKSTPRFVGVPWCGRVCFMHKHRPRKRADQRVVRASAYTPKTLLPPWSLLPPPAPLQDVRHTSTARYSPPTKKGKIVAVLQLPASSKIRQLLSSERHTRTILSHKKRKSSLCCCCRPPRKLGN